MGWIIRFFTSSIGQKIIMSLTGLFLVTFLIVHLIGNLQLFIDDGGEKFNLYAKFMTTNPLIKTVSYGLYAFILLHAVQGILIWRKNRAARGNQRYAVASPTSTGTNSFASRKMGWLGTVILIFILIHMYQFWLQMKLGALPMVQYEGMDYKVKDLYLPVKEAFTNIGFVIFYVISMVAIAFHLLHGIQSGFQTLGLNHKKYTPIIRFIGAAIAIVIPIGFAMIPIYFLITFG